MYTSANPTLPYIKWDLSECLLHERINLLRMYGLYKQTKKKNNKKKKKKNYKLNKNDKKQIQ